MGTLSSNSFDINGTKYTAQSLFHSRESLVLHMDQHLPTDFTLFIGNSVYHASESLVPPTTEGGGYWWPLVTPDWSPVEPVRVGLIIHTDTALADRQKAPVTGHFENLPSEHDGWQAFSFRLHFSETVDTTADALQDHVLSVSGTDVTSVQPIGTGNKTWAVSVTPRSHDAVTVKIEPGLDCALPAAVCTSDGRMLNNRMELPVQPKEKSPATGAPAINGALEPGQTLTADTSDIADADGLTGTTFTYHWMSYNWMSYDGKVHTDIPGATASTYTLLPSDDGKAFRVTVSFTDDLSNRHSLTSAPARSDRPHGLSASESDGAVVLTWNLPTGSSYGSLFQILRNRPELGEDRPLAHVRYAHAPTNTYTDTNVEPGVLYVYRVKGVDPFGFPDEASWPVEIRTGVPDTVSEYMVTVLHTLVITGTPQVGHTLTADTSGINDPDGPTNPSFTYQWIRKNGTTEVNIADATEAQYTLTTQDHGKTILIRVTFNDDHGNAQTETSLATPPVGHAAADLTAAQDNDTFPVISGYSDYGDLGTLSPDRWLIDGTNYTVKFLFHSSESLILGMEQQLPTDFTLHVGNAAYRASESKVPPGKAEARYWWPLATPDWTPNQPVQIKLAIHPDIPLGQRTLAPITGYFRNHPPDHDGREEFSFRLHFSEDIAATADAMRDHVLSVSGGTLSGIDLARGDGKVWEVSVIPDSRYTITIRIDSGADCQSPSTICTTDGRTLFNSMELTVPMRPNTPASGRPTIIGVAEAGQTLASDTSSIADADGTTGTTFSHQWVSYDGTTYSDIQGATDPTYTLTPDDEGKAFRLRVSFTDDLGYEESLTSKPTTVVVP